MTKTLEFRRSRSMGQPRQHPQGRRRGRARRKGGDLLSSLLGGGGLAAIVTALVKFANVDGKLVKEILGLVGPIVVDTIAAQFKNRALTPSALSSLMTEQKANVAGPRLPAWVLDFLLTSRTSPLPLRPLPRFRAG